MNSTQRPRPGRGRVRCPDGRLPMDPRMTVPNTRMTAPSTTVPHLPVPPLTDRPVRRDPGGPSPADQALGSQDQPERPRRRRSARRLVIAAAALVGVGARRAP